MYSSEFIKKLSAAGLAAVFLTIALGLVCPGHMAPSARGLTAQEKTCLANWLLEKDSSAVLDFIIEEYGLDRENLDIFIRERGGLSPKQEQALGQLRKLLENQNRKKAEIETLVRLVIDGISPLALLPQASDDSPHQFRSSLDTAALAVSDNPDDPRRSWVFRGPTAPTIRPDANPPWHEFLETAFTARRLAPGINLTLRVHSTHIDADGTPETVFGVINRGVYLTYVEGLKYPVVIKFMSTYEPGEIEQEMLSMWVANKIGLGPEFLGRLKPNPEIPDAIGLVMRPAGGTFHYISENSRARLDADRDAILIAVLDRMQAFNKQTRFAIQVLATKDSAAVIDTNSSSGFRQDYYNLAGFLHDRVSRAA